MFDKVLDEKTIQVSLVSGVVFFLLSNQPVLKFVEDLLKKTLNVRLNGNMLLLLHSVVFAVLVGVISFYVYQPLRPHLRGLFRLEEGQNMQCGPGMQMDPAGSGNCVAAPAGAAMGDQGTNMIPKNTTPLSACMNYDPNVPGSGNDQCMDGEYCPGDPSGTSMCVPLTQPTIPQR